MSIVQIIKTSVEGIQDSGVPYFEYGTWNEINRILESLNKNPRGINKKIFVMLSFK